MPSIDWIQSGDQAHPRPLKYEKGHQSTGGLVFSVFFCSPKSEMGDGEDFQVSSSHVNQDAKSCHEIPSCVEEEQI